MLWKHKKVSFLKSRYYHKPSTIQNTLCMNINQGTYYKGSWTNLFSMGGGNCGSLPFTFYNIDTYFQKLGTSHPLPRNFQKKMSNFNSLFTTYVDVIKIVFYRVLTFIANYIVYGLIFYIVYCLFIARNTPYFRIQPQMLEVANNNFTK